MLIEEFTSVQVEFMIGAERMKRLQQIRAQELFVSRTLRVIHDMSDEDFATVENTADVYWRSIEATMKVDLKKHREKGKTTLDSHHCKSVLVGRVWST